MMKGGVDQTEEQALVGNDKKENKNNASCSTSKYISMSCPDVTSHPNEPLLSNYPRSTNLESDPVGIHMARLLNEGAFKKANVRIAQEHSCQGGNQSLFPLISVANFNRTKAWLTATRNIFTTPKSRSDNRFFEHLPWWHLLIKALLFCVVILTIASGIILSILVRVYLFVTISLVTLLFDVKHMYNILCPTILRRFIDGAAFFIKQIEKRYFFAHLSQRWNYWGEQTRNPLIDRTSPEILLRARCETSHDTSRTTSRKSFDNVDWNMLRASLKSHKNRGQILHDMNVDHLMALNFSYTMMHKDHKEAQTKSKKKSKKNLASNGNTMGMEEDLKWINSGIVGDADVVRDKIDEKGNLKYIDTMHSDDGIEMVKATPRISRPLMKRQKSSLYRANLLSFDDEVSHQASRGQHVQMDEFQPHSRPRVYSETDKDFFGSDENSLDFVSDDYDGGESPDQKNKKWLDVGAKIGMRILKSEQMQDYLIAQTQTVSVENCGAVDDDMICIDSTDAKEDLELSSPQIPKPFHAMWQTEGDQMFEDFLSTDSEASTIDNKGNASSLPILGSPVKRRKSTSLPPRRGREELFNKSFSAPSSPRASITKASKIEAFAESEGNISITSSEAIQWVPREFDANRHLPASMAIHHGNEDKQTSAKINCILRRNEIRVKKLEIVQPKKIRRREPLLPGIKIIVPLFPVCSASKSTRNSLEGRVYQFATVVSSKRIALNSINDPNITDALSITVLLDKSFLRNGKFASMTMRILDSQRHFPRHSKFPIGDAIATSFGIGILVGWRSKDDCHILRALWQKRGQGSSHAYLNRNALHDLMEASVGFKVTTKHGKGKVVGYVNGGSQFTRGEYLIHVKKNGRKDSQLTSMPRSDVFKCTSAKFIPVVEQLKEAAKYQMQVDNYQAEKLQLLLQKETLLMDKTWNVFSQTFELFLSSFVKACEEDENFDSEISNFLLQFITFLEDFELDGARKRQHVSLKHNQSNPTSLNEGTHFTSVTSKDKVAEENFKGTDPFMQKEPGFWFLSDLFSNVHKNTDAAITQNSNKYNAENKGRSTLHAFGEDSYKKVYAMLTILMRTVSIAEAGCTDKPNLKMALAIVHETLLFVHNVIKVQQVNMTEAAVVQWKETIDDLIQLFGPMNARCRKVVNGIIQRLEDHGKIAKVRALAFAELLVVDDKLIGSLEAGDGNDCIARIENAALKAEILNEDARIQYHKLATLLYSTLVPGTNENSGAATRNGQKFTFFAKTIKVIATPARSALSLLTNDDVLDLIERVLIRVFEKEQDASQIINIYSWTFRTFRHLRILNNIAIVGNLWAAILDSADEEFTWAVSRTPNHTQQYVKPISKLFSLGVARFHELHHSDSSVSADWIDFLMEDEAIEIIQDLDGALLLFMRNFCKDMKDMMYILPYYSSIDDDILNLIDEFDPEKELKEIAEALGDTEKFPSYVREKSAKAVSVFLDYIPKMSIPIERREVGEGWVLTCRGRNGNDLTLSNVSIEKDNLFCRVFGSQVLGLDEIDLIKKPSMSSIMKDSIFSSDKDGNIEVSILDHVAELIRNAQSHGCWNVDSGGMITSSFLTASPLDGLPLSEVLHCAIELWENLQLDDDELLEIAIREISSQIQKHKARDDESESDNDTADKNWPEESRRIQKKHQEYASKGISFDVDICNTFSIESNSTSNFNRKVFNPRKDPTVLYLAMNQLTCCLDDFTYRLEPATRNSIFEPALEGVGTLAIKNASIKIRVECKKERINKLGEDLTIPVLQLQELEVGLEKVQFKFKETGADWLLNKVVSNFFDKITQLVRENLRKQMSLSIENTLGTLNRYIEVNPDLMLKILGITIDDLEENVAWV